MWLKRMIFGLALLLCLAADHALAAEIYWIQGVVGLPDGRPVENVAIYLDGQPAANTGVSGLYFISAASPGMHLVQPVKQGFVFSPEKITVTLPPDSPDVNFTAFQSEGEQEMALRLAPMQEAPPPTPTESGWNLLQRLAGLLRQLIYLLLALSGGALLVLAARRLGSRGWSHPVETAPSEALAAAESEPAAQAAVDETELAGWLREGVELVLEGRLEEGIARLRILAQVQPDNAEAWFWLGEASLAQGERRMAERCFRQAQRLEHPDAAARLDELCVSFY